MSSWQCIWVCQFHCLLLTCIINCIVSGDIPMRLTWGHNDWRGWLRFNFNKEGLLNQRSLNFGRFKSRRWREKSVCAKLITTTSSSASSEEIVSHIRSTAICSSFTSMEASCSLKRSMHFIHFLPLLLENIEDRLVHETHVRNLKRRLNEFTILGALATKMTKLLAFISSIWGGGET